MCDGVTAAHQKARARTDAMAENIGGEPFAGMAGNFGLDSHDEEATA
jgi:hypothetical protein